MQPVSITWTLAQSEAPPAPPAGQQPSGADASGAGGSAPQGQPVEQQPAPPKGEGQQPQSNPMMTFILLGGLVLVFVLLVWLPQRRERKRRNEMLSQLKKNDTIQTIGGIVGTIAEVRDQELIVKVDESSNTRLRMSRNAIQAVLNSDGSQPENNQ